MIKTTGLFILAICMANAVNVQSKIKNNMQAAKTEACGMGPCPEADDYFYTGVHQVGTDTVLNVVDECVSPGSYEFGDFTGGNPNEVSVIHTQLFTTGFCIPPIVVLGALTYNGGHATTVQLSQTETDFFNTWLQEWDQGRSDKNWHTTETWWYGAFQPGAYQFENGVNWQAGRVASNDQEWVDVTFASGHFASAPVVFATPVYPSSDFNWDEQAVGAITDVTAQGFRVKVARRVQDNTGPVDYPSINWFAVEQSEDGVSGTFEVNSAFTDVQFGGSDNQLTALFAQAQTFVNTRPTQGRVNAYSYGQASFGLHASDYTGSNTVAGDNVMGETMGYFAWRGASTGAFTVDDEPEAEQHEWVIGHGQGYQSLYMGIVSSYDECIQLVKTERPDANGATVDVGGVGTCKAEIGQTYVNHSQQYENTRFDQ